MVKIKLSFKEKFFRNQIWIWNKLSNFCTKKCFVYYDYIFVKITVRNAMVECKIDRQLIFFVKIPYTNEHPVCNFLCLSDMLQRKYKNKWERFRDYFLHYSWFSQKIKVSFNLFVLIPLCYFYALLRIDVVILVIKLNHSKRLYPVEILERIFHIIFTIR